MYVMSTVEKVCLIIKIITGMIMLALMFDYIKLPLIVSIIIGVIGLSVPSDNELHSYIQNKPAETTKIQINKYYFY